MQSYVFPLKRSLLMRARSSETLSKQVFRGYTLTSFTYTASWESLFRYDQMQTFTDVSLACSFLEKRDKIHLKTGGEGTITSSRAK